MPPMPVSKKLIKSAIKKGVNLYDNSKLRLWQHFVSYVLDYRYRRSIELTKWIKSQIDSPSPEVIKLSKKIPTKKNYDEQAVEILSWIINNITYVEDSESWKVSEMWQTAYETIANWYVWKDKKKRSVIRIGKDIFNKPKEYPDAFRLGDCEDGSALLYVLCALKGIPESHLYLWAGYVQSSPTSPAGGHCTLFYKPIGYPYNYVALDWSFFATRSRVSSRGFLTLIEKNITEDWWDGRKWVREDEPKYIRTWFLFNSNFSCNKLRLRIR